MPKSEKLFEVLSFIGECSDLTPKDLARLCNVSERAIYRYINTLSKIGMSIQFKNGGYKLQGNYSDILRKIDPEGLESLKLLLSAGMEIYKDERILKYGRDFIKLIKMNIPEKKERRLDEVEIVPEEVRATNRGGIITIGHCSKPDIINPILTSETISVSLILLIFSGLVRFDNAGRAIPDLAKEWEISKDGLVWTFFIRDDVSFHDGHPLTAHDVEFTYSAIMEPKNMSPRAKRCELIDRIESEGDYIFRITLKHPFAPFVRMLHWPIAPGHLLENVDLRNTSLNRRPVGSGPFKLTDWAEDDTIVLDANREYFRKDRPILDRLIFRTYPDRETARQAIADGQMDIALNLPASDLLFVNKRGSFRIYSSSGAFSYAIIFNLKEQVFKDIKVRKALNHAIDKDSIIANQLKGHGKICTGPFGVDSWAYNSDIEPTHHSVERARELLEQAGWVDTDGDAILDKNGEPFEISLTVPNISDTLQRIAIAIKAQLMRIGVRVNLEYIDDSELYGSSFQAIITMISTGEDPEYARGSWHSKSGGSNLASYKNSFVDDLMDMGREEGDPEKRKVIYHKIHEMIHDDCPAIFLASAFEYIGSNYRFRNDKIPSMMNFLTSMKDWQIVEEEREETVYEHQEKIRVIAD